MKTTAQAQEPLDGTTRKTWDVSRRTQEQGGQVDSLRRRQTTPALTSLAPQFLVDDLSAAITYYRDRLGFETDFVYESFYASVSRDGFSIHLKCAPKTIADRTHRKQNEHLDASIGVLGIEALFDELQSRGANILRPVEDRPWGCKDFYVEDLDGYILCFSERFTSS